MVNLFDITRQSASGAGLDVMSRQFGLDPAQTTRAIEAVLPAFTLAFQRLIMNPAAFADLMKVIGSGHYAPFFDAANAAQAAVQGGAILNQLFRSPDASDKVASQAAEMAGVGAKTIQAMMPALAATVAGGMFRVATAQGFAEHLNQWGDALKAASARIDPPKPQAPWAAWQQAAGAMMGLSSSPPPRPAPKVEPKPEPKAPPEPSSVLDAWVDLVGGMAGLESPKPAAPQAAPEPAPKAEPVQPPPAKSGNAANPFEALSEMFETGREVQAQHLAAFQSILDSVWGQARKA